MKFVESEEKGKKDKRKRTGLSIVTKNEPPRHFPSMERAFKPEEISESLIYRS